uniref:CSON006476 protein n=1 Tax=Culicoides sonorensis TaxID=179676 RepID=A0A336KBI1_CULSO
MNGKLSFYNQAIDVHKNHEGLNPFTSDQIGRRSPRLDLDPCEYGKPKGGSLTEMRGFKANLQILKDMLDLCEVIAVEGRSYNTEGHKMILFGELFQRRDDFVPIQLVKTINEIRSCIHEKQKEIQQKIKESPIADKSI